MSLRDRGVAAWLSRCFGAGFAHGSDLTEAIADACRGKCFTDNSDADRELASLLARGWIRSTGFRPTPQQRFAGVGGGHATAAYPCTHGYEPVREHTGDVEWFVLENGG